MSVDGAEWRLDISKKVFLTMQRSSLYENVLVRQRLDILLSAPVPFAYPCSFSFDVESPWDTRADPSYLRASNVICVSLDLTGLNRHKDLPRAERFRPAAGYGAPCVIPLLCTLPSYHLIAHPLRCQLSPVRSA